MKNSKDFIKEMNLSDIKKHSRPCLITMTGIPGSGKTDLAKTLSRKLKIFLLSNDYIRNYFYQFTDKPTKEEKLRIQQQVIQINEQRLIKLLLHRISFVFDFGQNSLASLYIFKTLAKIFRYELIKIKLISDNDNENIKRIEQRIMNYDNVDSSIIGDNVDYSISFSAETYYSVKERKTNSIPDDYFDYIIYNNNTKEEFENKIKKLIDIIKEDRLISK